MVRSNGLGVGLYSRGARCRAVVAADTRPAPRTRVHAHELGEGDGEGTDEGQGSRRRGRARGQEEKKPNAINARSATGFPWARGDES